MSDKELTRRDFIKHTTLAGLAVYSVPLIGPFANVSKQSVNSASGLGNHLNKTILCPPADLDDMIGMQGPYDEFLTRIDAKNIPFNIVLELTYRCNLRCHHCYQSKRDGEELDTAFIMNILNQLADNGCLNLSFSGGEPLLRSDLYQIAAYARNLGFACTLMTNATMINSEIADKIRVLSFAEAFVSLYGANAETHDLITGVAGSHKRTVNGIRLLTERGIETNVQTVVMKENVHELSDIEKLVTDMGAKFAYDLSILPKINGDMSPLEHLIDDEDAKRLSGYVPTDKRDAYPTLSDDSFVCAAGRTTCAITPEGDVLPCVALPLVAGNLKQRDFGEIWHSSPVFARLRKLTNADFAECINCSGRNECPHCLATSFLEGGDLVAPVRQVCRIWKEAWM